MSGGLVVRSAFLQKSCKVSIKRGFWTLSDRETGTVKWFDGAKGYGFITREEGDDVFVHFREIRGEGHRTLQEGQRVEFGITETPKGPQAEDVTEPA